MKKLMFSSQESLRMISSLDIIYCKSDNCYTSVFLRSGEELIACKSLKRIAQELGTLTFIRVNQSYLINKDFIKSINKKSKIVELLNNQCIPFTVTLKDLLMNLDICIF